ncbi:hypothetical protein [Streptomyces sp. NPDC058268]|uniref:hypothetical protein n=1 Tax=Streptomyces sp. NPDC058268 TaxID=3346413 RepID=UPI0036E5D2ED
MSGSFDVAQALNGGVCKRDRAWAFIRSFAACWGEPLVDVGSLTAELARVEATFGCSLPAALREFYALVGDRPDLVGNQDPLLLPHEMFARDECGGVLVFRSENQGCALWGVRLVGRASCRS